MKKNNKVPQGYKDSPLGIIPEEWEVKRLGEIAKIHVAKDLKMSNFSKIQTLEHIYPIYSNTVENEGFYGGYYDFEEYKRNCLTVVGRGIGLGTAFSRKKGFGAIGRLLIIYPNLTNDCKFITEYINGRINILIESAAIPQLTGEQFSTYKIALPPFTEQQKIAEILATWDKAIEKQTALIEKLELRKRGLMQQLLTGKKRLRGFSGEWKEVALGEICERVTRKNTENNRTVVTISAQRGFVSQTDFFNKSIASEILDNYYLVHKNEFCYNKSYCNGYPMGAIKRLKTFEKAVVTTLYICFAVKKETQSNVDFLEHFFESGRLIEGLYKVANEGGRAHGLLNITPTDFFHLRLCIPSLSEQTTIAMILASIDSENDLAKQKLAALYAQKQGLMQQLLTGKKRINYINF